VRSVAIVPTYNEAANIETVCRAIRLHAPDTGILVVDDNSPDGTADLIEKLADEIGDLTVVRRPVKTGLGGAYRTGMRIAIDEGADICIQMDADMSHDPAKIPALLSAVEHGVDLALGSRYVPGGITENWPRRRRWLSRWANRYAAGVLGLAINDATAGFRAYRSASLVDRMDFESVEAQGYGFQIEMTHRLVRAGGSIVEIPITFRDRTAGESKMSQSIIREAFLLVLALWLQDRRGRRERRLHGG
jgi:dolichol-phosphate mannosyltransferase